MKTIVYLTVNTVNNKIYIGIHNTNNPDVFDGYYGSGVSKQDPSFLKHPKTPFLRALKKYGFDAFIRVTLFVCDTREEAKKIERFIVNDEFISREDTYNIALGGDTPPIHEREIFQYSLSGKFLRQFNSIRDASLAINICDAAIGRAVNNNTLSGNFYWTDYKVDILDVSNCTKPQNKHVYTYDSTGKFIEEYESINKLSKDFDVGLASVQRAIKLGTKVNNHHVSFTKFDIFPVKARERRKTNDKIYQYDKEGNFVKEFKNSREAAEEIGLKSNNLSASVKLHSLTKGFYWSWEKVSKLPNINKQVEKKKVGRYDLDGNLLEVFETVRDCRKQYPNVSKVLKGTASHCHGFYFKYIIS